MWCFPPKQSAEFVYHMEDVLEVYHRLQAPKRPVVRVDELPAVVRMGRDRSRRFRERRVGLRLGGFLIARLPAREGCLARPLRRRKRARDWRCWKGGCRARCGQHISDVPGGMANWRAMPIDKRLHGAPEITRRSPAIRDLNNVAIRDLNNIRSTVPGAIRIAPARSRPMISTLG
jgi:hypothetical protein